MENQLAVEVEGLTKVFGSTLALDAVDLSAARGDVVALLGPNGAGKTTLLKLGLPAHRRPGRPPTGPGLSRRRPSR